MNIFKKLAKSYIKQQNLKKKKLSVNHDQIQSNTNTKSTENTPSELTNSSLSDNDTLHNSQFKSELSKVFSNLITTLYKLKINKKTEEYIKYVSPSDWILLEQKHIF